MKSILVIAGSDSISGAGIQADIKTAYKLNCHALSVITALTAQNSLEILDIMPISEGFFRKQIKAVLDDVTPDSVKIGMVFSKGIIRLLREILPAYDLHPIVLDPIIRSSTGYMLLEEGGVEELKRLFPISDVITPNASEAEELTKTRIRSLEDMERAASILHEAGAKNVVITGLKMRDRIFDLIHDGREIDVIEDEIITSKNSHGSGCICSTSLSIFLERGLSLKEAAQLSHQFTKDAIKRGYPLGRGSGPAFP